MAEDQVDLRLSKSVTSFTSSLRTVNEAGGNDFGA
jgi:hypothetical protein